MPDRIDEGLAAEAHVPSRVESVPAARAFLTKLLQGWSVPDEVVDDAALLTTEILANALEHGDGVCSMAVSLDGGVLHVAVADNDEFGLPHVLDPDSSRSDGRGMWIVDIVARDWGTAPARDQGGKTVWFELNTVPPKTVAAAASDGMPSRPTGLPPMARVPLLGPFRSVARVAARSLSGSPAQIRGNAVIVYEDKLSALLGEFTGVLLTGLPIQGILDRLVDRIADALPLTRAAVSLTAQPGEESLAAGSDAGALTLERLHSQLAHSPASAAMREGDTISVVDLAADRDFPDFSSAAQQAGAAAAFSFPLRTAEGQLGALTLYRSRPGEMAAQDLTTAQTMADVAAAYVVNAHARRAVQQMPRQAPPRLLRDPLTGLASRLMLYHSLGEAAQDPDQCVGVVLLDLDRFKQVNSAYGHDVGDELLVSVAARLSQLVRAGDCLARVSGDEFVVLCPDLPGPEAVERLAERIEIAFLSPFILSTVELIVTASLGMATSATGIPASDQLLVNAGVAMCQAKRSGGAGHQIGDLEQAERRTARLMLEQDLYGAFARHELALAYQPVVRSTDGLITGAEALLRWNHPEHGPVTPLDLIDIAEENGLIIEIGAWVLERACTDRELWRRDGWPLDIAVNVSARQLMAPGFHDRVAGVLQRTGMDPAALVLELTEGIFISDGDGAVRVLSHLKSLGLRLALDDFGTGYSSMSYLRRFPVDILKIDRSFVIGIGTDPAVTAIAEAMNSLARVLGLGVVAEGVETSEQRNEIVKVGCEAAQGYFFGRPMTAGAFADTLRAAATGDDGPLLPLVVSA